MRVRAIIISSWIWRTTRQWSLLMIVIIWCITLQYQGCSQSTDWMNHASIHIIKRDRAIANGNRKFKAGLKNRCSTTVTAGNFPTISWWSISRERSELTSEILPEILSIRTLYCSSLPSHFMQLISHANQASMFKNSLIESLSSL